MNTDTPQPARRALISTDGKELGSGDRCWFWGRVPLDPHAAAPIPAPTPTPPAEGETVITGEPAIFSDWKEVLANIQLRSATIARVDSNGYFVAMPDDAESAIVLMPRRTFALRLAAIEARLLWLEALIPTAEKSLMELRRARWDEMRASGAMPDVSGATGVGGGT